jgi:hypothetical protein
MSVPTYSIKLVLTKRKTLGRQAATAPDAYIPKDLFEDLPAQPPESTARSSSSQTPSDYRLGTLRIDWIDLNENIPISSSPVMRTFISGKDKGERGRSMFLSNRYTRP